jgi:hypothetical protein
LHRLALHVLVLGGVVAFAQQQYFGGQQALQCLGPGRHLAAVWGQCAAAQDHQGTMKRENLGRAQDVTATQPISLDVLKEKYLKAGETSAEDLFRRVARALASVEAEPTAKSTKPCSWPTCMRAPSAPGAS